MDPPTGNLILRTSPDPRISYLPEAEAGLDSGMFCQRYDALAEEIDEDMAKGLKEHLDGLLIFVGGLEWLYVSVLADCHSLTAGRSLRGR